MAWKAFEIKSTEDRDNCLMWVSDLYKDVYGFRPRCYNFNEFSNKELEQFVNVLTSELEQQEKAEKAFERKAVADVMSVGAPDEDTARRWLDDADAHYVWNDDAFAVEDMVDRYGWVAKAKNWE
jgi:hypothetical protein